MKDLRGKTLQVNAFHAPVCGSVEFLEDVLITVDRDGAILSVLRPSDHDFASVHEGSRRSGTLETAPPGVFLLPGFVDTHVHAPQYPQLGLALDEPLEVWLNRFTFPLEARYADAAFAVAVYSQVVDDLLANGSTTVVYFSTIHEEATRILVDTCLERGQRALVGKVSMDNHDQCPDYYCDPSADASIRGTINVIEYIQTHPDNGRGLVSPTVSPRFIPSCSDEALRSLGNLAHEYGCHVQTHCSESDWEHGYVLDRYGVSDTQSLDRFRLLGRRTVLAHSCFVSDGDLDTIRGRGSAVAHCPISNAYFANAVFPLRAALQKGVHVGLGTDISGGPNASIFAEMRAAMMVSRMFESGTDHTVPPDKRGINEAARIDFRSAFHVATAAGGVALDLPVGIFAPGYRFDAIAVDTAAAGGTIRLWDELDRGEAVLQKIVHTASRQNISDVWVDGRRVQGT